MEAAGQAGWTTAPAEALGCVWVVEGLKDNKDAPGLRDEGGEIFL